MLSKARPLDISSSLLSPCPSLLLPDHNSDRNLAWETQGARADISARTRAYPSPPMSGAPSVSSNNPRELYRQSRGSSAYSSDGVKDVYLQKRPVDGRLHLPPPQVSMSPAMFPSPYQQRPTMERSYTYLASDPHSNRSSPYPLYESQHEMKQGQSPQPFAPAPAPAPAPASSSSSAAPAAAAAATSSRMGAGHSGVRTSADGQVVGSPKAQRKTKGHVASACVPCKRAHLRCDAQRPCSRCISNSKEDSCVDVQHKKRGRPRLRDDRDARFESLRQAHGHPRDMSPRRHVDIHPSGGSGMFDDYYQRHQPYRGVDVGTSSGFPAARPGEPATGPDLSGYHTPLSATPSPPEPVAYLHMNLDFVKGSATFWDTLGLPSTAGRNLGDVVLPAELDKVGAIHSYFNNEQRRREPNYLPPIFGRGSEGIHRLGFAVEDFGRFPLTFQDHLVFAGGAAATSPRPLPFRAGLAKEGSFYFIVLLLTLPMRHAPRHQHAPPPVAHAQGTHAESPYLRISPGAFAAQHGPGHFAPAQVGRGDTVPAAHVAIRRAPSAREYGFDHAGRSPSSYRAAQDKPFSEALPPRGFLKEMTPPRPSHTPPSTFQLPPIRPQLGRSASSGAVTRDDDYSERTKRLAIGGLLRH
ncbi:hypothetical protein E4U42_002163 [Claviceps africana]|uniref:Zn(2)-C6 fungal-type domain-containing protein n=1 Tax=Claviceps africana TaxID=83212 RepID=A0A8K0J932_9HYPO|nr:hypothetical protein E4U42_002163 [Claviceps africana]